MKELSIRHIISEMVQNSSSCPRNTCAPSLCNSFWPNMLQTDFVQSNLYCKKDPQRVAAICIEMSSLWDRNWRHIVKIKALQILENPSEDARNEPRTKVLVSDSLLLTLKYLLFRFCFYPGFGFCEEIWPDGIRSKNKHFLAEVVFLQKIKYFLNFYFFHGCMLTFINLSI